MKTLIITLTALLMLACGGAARPRVNSTQGVSERELLNNILPHSIEEIDKELSDMLRGVEDDSGCVCYDDMMAFTKRLEHYLLDRVGVYVV